MAETQRSQRVADEVKSGAREGRPRFFALLAVA